MGALDGITVLDLAILVQGPQAAAMLHDLGATVIKVELPGFGDLGRYIRSDPAQGASGFFEGCNRGKRSVTLDLRTAGGKRALRRLVERADVLIHNFVPGTMESWGLSYEELSAVNPALVYAGGSTFGPLPDATREGADTLGQAAGGLMSTTGSDGEPPTAWSGHRRPHRLPEHGERHPRRAVAPGAPLGPGQRVEVSLLGGQIWAQCSELTHYLLHGQVPGRANRGHPIIKGLLRMVPTADGWIQLVGVPRQLWPAFAHAIDRPDLADDPRFLTLLYAPEDLAELCRLVDEIFPPAPPPSGASGSRPPVSASPRCATTPRWPPTRGGGQRLPGGGGPPRAGSLPGGGQPDPVERHAHRGRGGGTGAGPAHRGGAARGRLQLGGDRAAARRWRLVILVSRCGRPVHPAVTPCRPRQGLPRARLPRGRGHR
ncbi:MAG: CoA transferase [Acidimicrobiales bacterium]